MWSLPALVTVGRKRQSCTFSIYAKLGGGRLSHGGHVVGSQPDQQEVGHCLEDWSRTEQLKMCRKFCLLSPQELQGLAVLHKG